MQPQPTPEPGATLAYLRQATRAAHTELEGALNLLNPNLDLDRYRDILARFHGFWTTWQPQIAALVNDPAFLVPRQRLHLLQADLTILGLSQTKLADLPRCPELPLANAQEALGSLYVLEGATLGGRVIQRHIDTHLGETARQSCTYFAGYADQTGPMWRSFLHRLDQQPAPHHPAIAAGASATFRHMAWWLTRDPKTG